MGGAVVGALELAPWSGDWGAEVVRWGYPAALMLLAALVWLMWRQARLQARERGRERRLHEELEAYARLNPTLANGTQDRVDPVPAAKALGMRVCRTIAEKSAFTRVMMLVRDAEGSLRCVGSIGVDDLTVAALERWGEQAVLEERAGPRPRGAKDASVLGSIGARNIAIPLGEWHQFDPEVASWKMAGNRERRQWRRAIGFPIRTHVGSGIGIKLGRLVGVIVVCADGMSHPGERTGRAILGDFRTDRLVSGLETLAEKLGMAMENEALGARLLRAEKLAGLGQMAGGVAHALNNPLTAVLGYAELIAESSSEPRVREDASTIATQALKMRETVERLVEFWRPVALIDEQVDVLEMIEELADTCRAKLSARGARLEVVEHGAGAAVPTVRGCRERLLQVMEHLVDNAAQAISDAGVRDNEEHAIRISVAHDEHTLNLIVSDTGTGFEEPGRAFDPFYTTRDPVEGAGMGLSICYGIVREHGGEIAAFNLHPHGGAVVVELPLGRTVADEGRLLVEDEVAR